MNVVIGIGVVVGVLAIIGLIVWINIGEDPPDVPTGGLDENTGGRDRLFQAPVWRKALSTVDLGPNYNRPLDVNPFPDDQILPPPREVRGINGVE